MPKKIVKSRKKVAKEVFEGRIYIHSSFNNTLITVTDNNGNAIASGSAGAAGFKGSKKATPYAAGQALKTVLEKAKSFGLKKAITLVSGVGPGRDASLRAISQSGLTIDSIKDITPIPHNGCRPKKTRRI